MMLGKIVGTVVSTQKDASLEGFKLLIAQPLTLDMQPAGGYKLMVDTVGAGVGEIIIYTTGTASRNAIGNSEASIDAAVIGIVDTVTLVDGTEVVPSGENLIQEDNLD